MEVVLDSEKKCNNLEPLDINNISKINKYIKLRDVESCEYSLTTLFMWKNMYNPHLYIDENFLIIFEHYEGECYALMPLCKEKYFVESFNKAIDIFNELVEEFEMYCVDSQYANVIKKSHGDRFDINADRNIADYIYSGEALRKLSGKKLRKKKNHINAFKRNYEGLYEFKLLNTDHKLEIMEFLNEWCLQHGDLSFHLQEEIDGISYILDHIDSLGSKIAGITIGGKLEALSVGSLINKGREAVIHVEKANQTIRGLYPFINQQFLLEVFPDVELVNREDDLGLEGLRKAKMSYEPLRLEEKYTLVPKN